MSATHEHWTITVQSPGDRQTLAAIVAECRHRLADHLPAARIGSICQTVWDLGAGGQAVRIELGADHASATPMVGAVSATLTVSGLMPSPALAMAS